MTICEGDGAQLEGTGENICNIQWVTVDGTGEFNDETILTPACSPPTTSYKRPISLKVLTGIAIASITR
jgi:hypothetical protein